MKCAKLNNKKIIEVANANMRKLKADPTFKTWKSIVEDEEFKNIVDANKYIVMEDPSFEVEDIDLLNVTLILRVTRRLGYFPENLYTDFKEKAERNPAVMSLLYDLAQEDGSFMEQSQHVIYRTAFTVMKYVMNEITHRKPTEEFNIDVAYESNETDNIDIDHIIEADEKPVVIYMAMYRQTGNKYFLEKFKEAMKNPRVIAEDLFYILDRVYATTNISYIDKKYVNEVMYYRYADKILREYLEVIHEDTDSQFEVLQEIIDTLTLEEMNKTI